MGAASHETTCTVYLLTKQLGPRRVVGCPTAAPVLFGIVTSFATMVAATGRLVDLLVPVLLGVSLRHLSLLFLAMAHIDGVMRVAVFAESTLHRSGCN